jgi:rSAM/selenodomain-associated transferase 1
MPLADTELAIFAKAPQRGYAKTRLIPALGAAGAARLQRELTLRAVRLSQTVQTRRVTLWCAPDTQHRFFRALHKRHALALQPQSPGDLGQRMSHAFATHGRPLLLIGSDCPALTTQHLQQAAQTLHDGNDAVFVPAEDGGYMLVGLRAPQPALFENIAWSTSQVMAQTRERVQALGLRWRELDTLWDVDRPQDVARWQAMKAQRA